jgi:uncharacterized protein YidB (DUF937 family)
MGLFESLKGKLDAVTGAAEMATHAPALKDAVLELLAHKDQGGLAGLLDKFKGQGLGDIASSWVSTGGNLPVNAQQISQALGPKAVGFLAEKTGMAPEKISAGLTFILPLIVDKLTPQGKLPESNKLAEALTSLKGMKF